MIYCMILYSMSISIERIHSEYRLTIAVLNTGQMEIIQITTWETKSWLHSLGRYVEKSGQTVSSYALRTISSTVR